MIEIIVSPRLMKTVARLGDEVRHKAEQQLAHIQSTFGKPHLHSGIGLRKLSPRVYEARLWLQWRLILIHEGRRLIAYDVMNHDEVRLWLRKR